MTDEHKYTDEHNKTPEEKIWENLTKDYLTIDQKLDIIREHNAILSEAEWNKTINALRDHLKKNAK